MYKLVSWIYKRVVAYCKSEYNPKHPAPVRSGCFRVERVQVNVTQVPVSNSNPPVNKGAKTFLASYLLQA